MRRSESEHGRCALPTSGQTLRALELDVGLIDHDAVGALARRGRHLRTTAEAFRTAHHLPRWFDQLRHVTPASVWTSSPDVEEFETALAEMPEGPAVIKDYCKSEKDYWHEAMFIPDGPPALTPPPSPRPGTTYPLRRGGGNRF